MVIESRTIVGAAAAFALAGALLWASALLLATPEQQADAAAGGSVEVRQLPERSWAVEIKDLGAQEPTARVAHAAPGR